MAYNKKNWQDNVSDITAAELNKIEQGIYDNSLVVDAVTNTLNPTDTETYKTAELTEGQITDVIGVSDIVIKGDTSQNGEPTPDSPVDVNVVSGSNVINTSNKNLLIPSVIVDNTAILTNNCQVLLIKDEYIITATENDMYFGRARGAGVVYSNEYGQKIYVNNNINTKISFYITNTNLNNVYITAYNSEGVSLGFTGFASNRGTYTLPEDCDFITFRMGKDRPIVGTDYKTKVMIVYGDVIPTTYEPHQGKELPLDLPVKNLFDKNNETYTKAFIYDTSSTSLIDSNYQRTLYIPCKPNTTYAIQKMVAKDSNKFFIASSVDVPAVGVNIYNVVNGGMNSTRAIYTTPNNAKYLLITYMQTNATSTTLQEILNSIQIEESSKANAYTPYGTEPIELCKIGDYQDYFYKSGSRWYLVKNFNKYIEELNNSWVATGTASGSEVNTKRWQINKVIADSFDVNGGSMNRNMYCNYFNRNLLGQMYGLDEAGYNLEANTFSIRLPVEIATTATEVAQYFSQQEKPLTFYYQIAPTTIEITGTLKEQLEAIYNAPLYEQTNITQTNNDLPMVLDITACKDNINGIKAFIRK